MFLLHSLSPFHQLLKVYLAGDLRVLFYHLEAMAQDHYELGGGKEPKLEIQNSLLPSS